MLKKLTKISFSLVILTLIWMNTGLATPFTISATLTGDPRLGNPDNLIAELTILGDTSSADTYWTLDINSPLHPDIKLDAFYFNLDVAAADVSFTNFSPTVWSVTTPANNAAGSGSADFLFEADRSGGPTGDVTNSTDLTFTASLTSGTWSENMFLNALPATSNDAALGSFQVGAHLQSLAATGNESDSGFASGDYVGGSTSIPEPTTMLLFGTGLAGLAGIIRKKRK